MFWKTSKISWLDRSLAVLHSVVFELFIRFILLSNTKTLGIDPMFVETSTFGWLAKQRLENKKIDLRSSTGAIPSLTGEVF